MSNSPSPSPLSNDSLSPAGSESNQNGDPARSRFVHSLKGSTQFLSFWIAVALPFVHLPLLTQGLGNPRITFVFLALLGLNVLALYIGRDYNQS